MSSILHEWVLLNRFEKGNNDYLNINSTNQMSRFTVKDVHKKLRSANLKITVNCIKHKSVGLAENVGIC